MFLNSIRKLIKAKLRSLAHSDSAWSFLERSILPISRYLEHERREHNRAISLIEIENLLCALIPEMAVRHGPFKGLRYPKLRSVGSELFPKLLGSYERELHALIEEICSFPYSAIVDLGCAEGYYAVGLAMRIPDITVYAFDLDENALALCSQMAKVNGVSDRLVLENRCTIEVLQQLPLGDRALIVSDCEGCERELFSDPNKNLFVDHDLLIEIHDQFDIETSREIRETFRQSHKIQIFQSIDDIKKAHTYDYPELQRFSLIERRRLLAENRSCVMEWFFLQSIKNNS